MGCSSLVALTLETLKASWADKMMTFNVNRSGKEHNNTFAQLNNLLGANKVNGPDPSSVLVKRAVVSKVIRGPNRYCWSRLIISTIVCALAGDASSRKTPKSAGFKESTVMVRVDTFKLMD
jgi:hypothetical protein